MTPKQNPTHDEQARFSVGAREPAARRETASRPQFREYIRTDMGALFGTIVVLLGGAMLIAYAALLIWFGTHMPLAALPAAASGEAPAWSIPLLHANKAIRRAGGWP